MKNACEMFEDSISHLIHIMEKEDIYFLREADIQCFLYKDLFNKFKRRKLFASYGEKRLFPILTEHQYKNLHKPKAKENYLKGKALDLVVLNENTSIKIAVEIKFSTPVKKNERKQSAGNQNLTYDIIKLRKSQAHYKYLIYYKVGGNCFITSDSKGYPKRRKKFFKKFENNKNLKHFKMYYIEKDDKLIENKFKLLTISKEDYKPKELALISKYDPKKHFNIFIYSNIPRPKKNKPEK